MSSPNTVIERNVREIAMRLLGGNRSLELCSRMNYETEVLDLIDAQEKGTVFYDLGACEGRFAVYAALKGLRVYAFEPDPSNFSALLENIWLNSLSAEQLTPFQLGVGESTREAVLKIGQPWAGGHQKVVENPYVRCDVGFDFKRTAKVQLVGLDEFIECEGLARPQCLKVDVDGSERAFMEGSSRTLASPELQSLMMELEADDPHFDWILDQFTTANFVPTSRHPIPNEERLFNFRLTKKASLTEGEN
jgi:FkbM family methyltransferase